MLECMAIIIQMKFFFQSLHMWEDIIKWEGKGKRINRAKEIESFVKDFFVKAISVT